MLVNKASEDLSPYLKSLLKEGVESYIPNVQTNFQVVDVGGALVPLTINEREYDNSYITSNYYAIEHFGASKPWLKGAGLFLKRMKINRSIIINNWLFTNNLHPQLSSGQLQKLTDWLVAHYPTHLLIFRNLNTRCHHALCSKLSKLRYKFFPAREVYFFDPDLPLDKKARYHHRRDQRLLNEYCVTENEKDYDRSIELYERLYIDKYSAYSPRYTAPFLEIAAATLNLVGLRRDGVLEGVFGYVKNAIEMTVPFFGFDPTSERSSLIYRALTMCVIERAQRDHLLLNDGHGGERAKRFRGMRPFNEFAAVYDKHLPVPRRLFWGLADLCTPDLDLSQCYRS